MTSPTLDRTFGDRSYRLIYRAGRALRIAALWSPLRTRGVEAPEGTWKEGRRG